MEVTTEVRETRQLVREARQKGCRIGCVPTMGALHAGHLSLIEECRKSVDFVLVTIFVNPTQFGPSEDLEQYPRPLAQDLNSCEHGQVDVVFTPKISTLYPEGFDTWVECGEISRILEGASRPGHFRGVTTIVAKLLNIVQPDVACFGQKDYQQQTIIRQMVRDLNIPTEIVVCPTLREADGLALSSRNAYLNEQQRASAVALFQALERAQELLQSGEVSFQEAEEAMIERLKSFEGVDPEYAVIRNPDTLQEPNESLTSVVALIAARLGQTRLIDNRTIPITK